MQPKPTTSVSVEHADGEYHVLLTNNLNQSIRAFSNQSVNNTLKQAADFAEFFGVRLIPFKLAGRVINVASSGFYSDDRERSFEEFHQTYRMKNGSLNWNKVMHYEWPHMKKKFKQKAHLRDWLLPHAVHLEIADEAARVVVRQWLADNCIGSWLSITGGFRFSNDRDATLVKLYHQGVHA